MLAAAAVWLALPGPIDPAAYRPPPAASLTGPLAPNQALRGAEILAAGRVHGPEDVAVDAAGRVYAGTADGRIVRLSGAAGGDERVETFATTGGRPLGLDFDAAGTLWVADARRGLLTVSPAGEVRRLVASAEGVPFAFTNDVDVGPDGRVYFTDASSRYGVDEYLYDLLEARGRGRLLVYDPAAGDTRVLARDLAFANGVAVAADGAFVLVNETYRYRIHRCWLAGEGAGRCELFAERLPGFPDGIASAPEGTFWVALFTVRNPLMDRLHPHPWLKRQLAKLPRALWPKPAPYGLALELGADGRVLGSLHDPGGERVRQVTSVEPVAETAGTALYLGNLDGDSIAVWRP